MRPHASSGQRELTARAIGFGLLMGGLLAAGNVYTGIKVAFLDGGATTLVLVSVALFAALRRPLSALEANIAQAAGSSAAVMALTAGVIGPMPALAMSDHAPSPVWIGLWGASLGLFGSLIAVPFRRQLIEDEAMPFPSGLATGELIKDLSAAGARAARSRVLALFVCLAAAALLVVLRDAVSVVPAELPLPIAIGGIPAAALAIGFSPNALILGVGLLVGVRVALSMALGGAVAWAGLAPLLHRHGAIASPDFIAGLNWLVWPGASMMVASSLTSLALSAGALWRGWSRRRADAEPRWRWLRRTAALGGAAIVLFGWIGFGVNPLVGLFALALSVVFSVIAMRATGETDQAPCGPLGTLAQGLAGAAAPGSTLQPLFAGGVTNGVTAHASSMMQSWKAGREVGASPARVLAAQIAGVAVGTVTAVLAYVVLDHAYGIGSQALPSPIAMSWKVTAEVVQQGLDSMPPGAPIAALVAAAAGVLLTLVERGRAGRFAPSPVGLAVGFIVPLSTTAGIALGALLFAAARRARPAWCDQHGTAIAAGLITGEALTGIVVASLVVAGVV